MKLRHFIWKSILAEIRGCDYAHAGEEEAIEIALQNIPKNKNQLLLDIGCGRGGTAKYVQDHGWGKVTGIDVEEESIISACKTYPEMDFITCDAKDTDKMLIPKFNVLYSFNVFYAIENKLPVLQALRKVAAKDAQLIIFDYINRNNYVDINKDFYPITLPKFADMLTKSGWHMTHEINLDKQSVHWYNDLLQRIINKREYIIEICNEDIFHKIYERYLHMLNGIKEKKLGSGIIFAK